jgi:hypothetical protein
MRKTFTSEPDEKDSGRACPRWWRSYAMFSAVDGTKTGADETEEDASRELATVPQVVKRVRVAAVKR